MKIGFACIYMLPPEQAAQANSKAELARWEKYYRLRDTTIKWLNENRGQAEDRLWEILEHNVDALFRLVKQVISYPDPMQMVRFGSGVCPAYTHKDWSWFYQQSDVQQYMQKHFSRLGKLIRAYDIKVSFHPGQYTVLASDNPNIVESSIEEFEYHVDICRYLGFGRSKLDMKVNVHLSGKGGISQFNKTFKRLSPEARNVITLENDEFGAGIDDILPLYKKVGIVLDIHHHLIHTRGDYIKPNDKRMKPILESWDGKRPTIHYSCSREEYLLGENPNKFPKFSRLLDKAPVTKLRAHSMMYPNNRLNDWALSFLPTCDIMCEAKAKNLASGQLYLRGKELNLL